MRAVEKWLEAAKRAAGVQSDYALAKALGVGHSRLSMYRSGASRAMNDDLAMRIADLTGAHPSVILAELHADRAKSEKVRSAWLSLAGLARKYAAVLLVLLGSGLLEPTPHAGSSGFSIVALLRIMYIM